MVNFDSYGNPIPPGLQNINKEDFEQDFAILPNADIRNTRLCEWKNFVIDLKIEFSLKTVTQWIGGSFTTKKPNPSDIDLVNIFDYKIIQHSKKPLFSNPNPGLDSRKSYNIDSYAIIEYPQSDKRYSLTEKQVDYWKKWFGKTRNGVDRAIFRIEV